MSTEPIEDIVAGSLVGNVLPTQVKPPLPHKDAREYALERLRDFICTLVFRRTGEEHQPDQSIGFMLKSTNVHVYQPDDPHELQFPSIGILPSRGIHEAYGLGPPMIIEESWNVYGKDTALVRQSEYTELVPIEVIATHHPMRRAIVAGLKSIFRQSEDSDAIRLTLPKYYDQVAQFRLDESQYIDDPPALLNRRRSHLFVELRVCEVSLTNVRELRPHVELHATDGNVSLEIDC